MWELRYDVHGRCAVRVAGGGVLGRHVVAAPPDAPWVIEACAGTARGWLLAAATPEDPGREAAKLEAEVLRRTALARERQALTLAALDAELLERLTHRLRTDVMTLATVAEGALEGVFAGEGEAVAAELRRTSQDAQRRITAAREVMTVLDGRTGGAPERVASTLRAELEGVGRAARVTVSADEEPWTAIAGAGWAACARILAAEARLEAIEVAPDEAGWRVTLTLGADGAVGDLARAGHMVVAAGGQYAAHATRAELVVPAAVG